jgi:hypothetical protein
VTARAGASLRGCGMRGQHRSNQQKDLKNQRWPYGSPFNVHNVSELR